MPLLIILLYLLVLFVVIALVYALVIVASFTAGHIAAQLSAITIGKAAKLDRLQSEDLYVWFYLVAGFLTAVMNVLSHSGSDGGGGLITFVAVTVFWPICLVLMNFNDPYGDAWGLKIGIFIATFFIIQMIAVIKVLARAKRDIRD